MSSHADTIRALIPHTSDQVLGSFAHPSYCKGCEAESALDALLAENQRYEKALERVKRNAESWHGADPDGIDNAHHGQQKALDVIAGWCREALAGDADG